MATKAQSMLALDSVYRNIIGTFHLQMGKIKDRRGKDLIETEEIKKRWKTYPKELYKKDLNDQITTRVW